MDWRMDDGASRPASAMSVPEKTSCFFLGGALTERQVSECPFGQDRDIKELIRGRVKDDILHMLKFVTKNMVPSDCPPGDRFAIQVDKILLNSEVDSDIRCQVRRELELDHDATSLYQLGRAASAGYTTKKEVRCALQQFVFSSWRNDSKLKNLILFMTGDGSQDVVCSSPPGTQLAAQQQTSSQRLIQQSFCLPMPGGRYAKYTDKEFTEDIGLLPDGKRLYIVMHSCHSGGMVKFWKLDTTGQSVAVFASKEADILREWDVDTAGYVKTFCERAVIGNKLQNIGDQILLDTARPPQLRPSYNLSRPKLTDEPFLTANSL